MQLRTKFSLVCAAIIGLLLLTSANVITGPFGWFNRADDVKQSSDDDQVTVHFRVVFSPETRVDRIHVMWSINETSMSVQVSQSPWTFTTTTRRNARITLSGYQTLDAQMMCGLVVSDKHGLVHRDISTRHDAGSVRCYYNRAPTVILR